MTETIRDLIEKSGKTLEVLAEAAELSPGFLSRVQNGERALSSATRPAFARALGVHLNRLMAAEAATLQGNVSLTPVPDDGVTTQSEARPMIIRTMRNRMVMEILDLPDEYIPAADKMFQAIRLMVAASRPQKGEQTS